MPDESGESVTYRAHWLGRLYVGLLLPALGLLLVAIPGREALAGGDKRGMVASAAGLLVGGLLTLRFNRRAYWTVVFQPPAMELRASARQARISYDDVEIIERVTWPFPANHVRLLTRQGARSVPYMTDQEGFITELTDRCQRASVRE